MRILTRTYPPTINPNYGGILQAWAVQETLSRLGHVGYIDAGKSSAPAPTVRWFRKASSRARDLAARLRLLPRRYQPKAVRWAANRDILSFSTQRFNLVNLYRGGRNVDEKVVAQFDAFVVGSDQIWRPDFVDVASYLLDFLPADDTRPRIAYAASFGSSSPAALFEQRSTAMLGPLARRFDAVSVREDSGIELCKNLWAVNAVRRIDPTMLLEPHHYAELAGSSSILQPVGLVTYILDPSPDVMSSARQVATSFEVPITELYRPLPERYTAFSRDRDHFNRMTVEAWLAALLHSEAVVTDSYHGTVFAILFNKPFLLAPNKKRGLARFETLLEMFSLQGRVARFDGADLARMQAPIDWDSVNDTLARERMLGLDFLRNALSTPTSQGDTSAAVAPQSLPLTNP
jgi:hypothetical protein